MERGRVRRHMGSFVCDRSPRPFILLFLCGLDIEQKGWREFGGKGANGFYTEFSCVNEVTSTLWMEFVQYLKSYNPLSYLYHGLYLH